MNALQRTPRQIVLDMYRAADVSNPYTEWRKNWRAIELGRQRLRRLRLSEGTLDTITGCSVASDDDDFEEVWA